MHGIAVAFEFLTRKLRGKLARKIPHFLYDPASRLLTFSYVCLAWIFFRAPNLNMASIFLRRLFSPATPWRYANEFEERSLFVYGVFGIACTVAIDLLSEYNGGNNLLLNNKITPIRLTTAFCMLVLILLIGVLDGSHFIYFQF